MEIWDYGIEDGDVISILQNDKPIIENLTVSRKKKKITIELQDGKNELKIVTINTGKLKTNTTKLKLYDFRRQYEVIANLEKDKPSIINVVKLKVKRQTKK